MVMCYRSQRTVGYFVNFIEHLEQKLFLELLEFGYFLVKAGAHVDDQIAYFRGRTRFRLALRFSD